MISINRVVRDLWKCACNKPHTIFRNYNKSYKKLHHKAIPTKQMLIQLQFLSVSFSPTQGLGLSVLVYAHVEYIISFKIYFIWFVKCNTLLRNFLHEGIRIFLSSPIFFFCKLSFRIYDINFKLQIWIVKICLLYEWYFYMQKKN